MVTADYNHYWRTSSSQLPPQENTVEETELKTESIIEIEFQQGNYTYSEIGLNVTRD